MLTGALAVSYYGAPRTTTDVDIVIRASQDEVRPKIVPALKKASLHADAARIETALRSGFRIVTIKDSKSPFTLDIIFSSKKAKKKIGTILGLPTFFQTAEELINAKLRMVKATVPKERTIKDIDDVKAILKFSQVNIKAVKTKAKKDSTLTIIENILAETVDNASE
jgi:hypothetical protein